jgi:DNA-binding transcriptional regulator YiaG
MANNKEKRPLTKEESSMLFDYFHNKSAEDIAEDEYQEFMESDFFQEEVAERIEEWTSLSYREIEKIREDVGAEYEEEFTESNFLEEVVAKRIKDEGRTLSNEDIKKIREDVEMSHLDGFCNGHNERMKELEGYRIDHNEIDKWGRDHGYYYSLNNFAALSWSDWRDDLDVLDVDDCLSQHRDAKRPGEKIDEAIVKPLFLKAYGIKLS